MLLFLRFFGALLLVISFIYIIFLIIRHDEDMIDLSMQSIKRDFDPMVKLSLNNQEPDFKLLTLQDVKNLSNPALYIDLQDRESESAMIETLRGSVHVSRPTMESPMKLEQETELERIDLPTMSRLMRAAQYAAVAYCPSFFLKNWKCRPHCVGFTENSELILTFQSLETDTTGYIALQHHTKSIIIAFRGSKSAINWFNNFKFFKRSLDWQHVPLGVSVHRGFYITYMVIRDFLNMELIKLLRQYPDYVLDIVGHSLGGAIASLAALDIKSILLPSLYVERPIHLVTFGQPRVGNKAFSLHFGKFFQNNTSQHSAYHVVTYADLFPHVPPAGLGFQHHTQEIWQNTPLMEKRHLETTYCSPTDYEDPRCSNSLPMHELRVDDHMFAWNITMGHCY